MLLKCMLQDGHNFSCRLRDCLRSIIAALANLLSFTSIAVSRVADALTCSVTEVGHFVPCSAAAATQLPLGAAGMADLSWAPL